MKIDDYIEHAFRHIDSSKIELTSGLHYSLLSPLANNHLPAFLATKVSKVHSPSFHLKTIYAFNKTSQLITLGGKSYIIHNRYLGQTLNNLNKIILFAKDGGVTRNYLLRLITEELYANGNDTSAACVSNFRKYVNSDNPNSFFASTSSPEVSIRTLIQEMFIVSHEIIHFYLAEYLDKSNLVAKWEDRLSNICHSLFSKEEKDRIKKRFAGLMDIEEGFELGKNLFPQLVESTLPEIDYEEFVADSLSLEFLFHTSVKLKIPTNQIFPAIHDLLRHLRVLTFIREYLALTRKTLIINGEEMSLGLLRASLRLDTLGIAFIDLHNRGLVDFDIRKGFLERVEIRERYRKVIDEPAFYGFSRNNNILTLSNIIRIDLEKDTVKYLNPKSDSTEGS